MCDKQRTMADDLAKFTLGQTPPDDLTGAQFVVLCCLDCGKPAVFVDTDGSQYFIAAFGSDWRPVYIETIEDQKIQ